jgi:hypothetical protein
VADDVATPLNPPVAPVDMDKLEEATFDGTPLDEVAFEVNVSQRPREEEPSKRMVCTQVDCSVWYRRLSPNPHA